MGRTANADNTAPSDVDSATIAEATTVLTANTEAPIEQILPDASSSRDNSGSELRRRRLSGSEKITPQL